MSAAAFLNSASKGLGIAKQFALQKAGKATASAEDPEFLAACEVVFRILIFLWMFCFAGLASPRCRKQL
jgi:hypothetical protein